MRRRHPLLEGNVVDVKVTIVAHCAKVPGERVREDRTVRDAVVIAVLHFGLNKGVHLRGNIG